jgi:hypothetical protein
MNEPLRRSLERTDRTRWRSTTGLAWPSHILLSVQLPIRSMLRPQPARCRQRTTGRRALLPSTISRAVEPSPARFPNTHMACSKTSSFELLSKETSVGTAPCLMRTCVCSAAPAAMFVSAQSASTWLIAPHHKTVAVAQMRKICAARLSNSKVFKNYLHRRFLIELQPI